MSASLMRRPTSPAPVARAAATFHPPAAPPSEPGQQQRTTVLYPTTVRRALKARAALEDSTLAELVRTAIVAGLRDTAALVAGSRAYQRITGSRTTLDLPVDDHRTLKVLAAQEDTSVQALVLAAIHQSYPDLRE